MLLHICPINQDQMYSSWDMQCNRQNLFIILGHLLPFTPLKAWKMKISKKWKTYLEISSFYTSLPKTMIIGCTVPEIWWMTDVIVIFHFGLFFALLPLWQPKKWKLQKSEKNAWRYHFTPVYQKSWSCAILLLRYGTWHM